MVKNVFFIGGIHGTGKSTLCSHLKKSLGVPHYSASAIIKEKKNIISTKSKIANNIDSNQDALSQTLNHELNHDSILLDGHFSLFAENYTPTSIPDKVFEEINIKYIACLVCDPQTIKDRILERDGKDHPVDMLKQLQALEANQAKHIAEKLGVPIVYIDTDGITPEETLEIVTTLTETFNEKTKGLK